MDFVLEKCAKINLKKKDRFQGKRTVKHISEEL